MHFSIDSMQIVLSASALDARTARHPSFGISQRIRMHIEKCIAPAIMASRCAR